MRTAKHIIASFLIVLGVAIGSVFACDCAGFRGPINESIVGGAVNAATAVFQGKVIGFEYRKGIINDFMSYYRDENGKPIGYETMVVQFSVDRWWKGDLARDIVLVMGQTRNSDGTLTSNSCDFEFNRGETYLVFARLDKAAAMLRTSICGLTREANDGIAAGTRKVLGEGTPPNKSKLP